MRNPQLNPLLGKLNWIYAREGQDDLEAALAGLAAIFEGEDGSLLNTLTEHRDFVNSVSFSP